MRLRPPVPIGPFAPSSCRSPTARPTAPRWRSRRRRARWCTPATSASSTRPSGAAAATCPPWPGWATAASTCCWPTPPTRRRARRPRRCRPATCESELARIFATADGRVLVTTFSSHIHRVQQVLDAAYADGRVVALVGRSLTRNVGMASNLIDPETGQTYLTPPPGTLVRLRELETHPRDEQVLICTGSQGEPMAALSRIARGEHNQVHDRARRHGPLLVEHGPRQRAGGQRDRQPPRCGPTPSTSPSARTPASTSRATAAPATCC